ncbi:receptor-type tyrosine-protein phosphatase T isoform X2 [Octopus bimaculoides]|nr:receptor-type tyrosine-protein phosphatase T isoform X2 [Octopus bimaculoides]
MALMFGDTATVILLVAIHVYLVHSRFLSDSAFLNGRCPKNKFGMFCKSKCHCKSSASCDTDTGVCLGTVCENSYMGPNCQQRKIMPKYNQKNDKKLSVVFDGTIQNTKATHCYHTQHTMDSTVSMWVGKVKIKRLVVYTLQSEIKLFQNFKVYASDRKNISNGTLLYENSHAINPNGIVDINFPLSKYGNRLFIVLPGNNRKLNLCEVLIGGDCNSGWFSENCSRECHCKRLTKCNSTNGDCIGGCIPGWKGSNCYTKCSEKKYGEDCQQSCSSGCLDSVCHHITGYCTNGCQPGYIGHQCDRVCYRHTYGIGCNKNCSETCIDQLCHHETGNCTKGCLPGFKDSHCLAKCSRHTYGYQCARKCSANCLYQTCNHINGRCINGCIPGYQGHYCNSTCSNNKYGFRCLNNCSKFCVDQECNHIHGHCTKYCNPGYQGQRCDTSCEHPFYGSGCMTVCSEHCVDGKCHHVTGFCNKGCEPGYLNPLCITACPRTYFGQDCSKKCNHTCYNQTCQHFNGSCLEGCILGYTGTHCSKVIQSGEQSQLDMFHILTAALVANIIILILCVLCFRYFRSPKTQPPKLLAEQAFAMGTVEHAEESDHLMSDQTNGGLRLTDGSNADIQCEDEIIYMNVGENDIIIPDSIPVDELQSYIQNKRNFEGGFGAEYRRLSQNTEATCKAANLQENKAKNRYKNIVAYDHSRVILEKCKDSDSDYINANYIDGFNKPKKYIASQGPTSAIIADFWQMLWQVNCTKLVMLTNLIETGKTKCEKYWPDKEVKISGDLKIRCIREQNFSDFTIRSFFLQKGEEPVRKLDQFHFTSWSDHGVPPTPTGLVNFMMKIRNDSEAETGPLVVHCSAGIGRSGTFIALDFLMDEALHQGTIDIFGCVNRMRKARLNMVQIEDQYEFIYFALVESIFLQQTQVTIENFPSFYQKLNEENEENVSCKTLLQQHFQELQELEYPHTSQEFLETAKLKNNLNKTRVKNILASDLYRPYLKPAPDGQPRYINAVYLPSHENPRNYIATQMPMKETIEDFWQMVCDIQSSTIVMLNSDDSMDETCCKYWKDDGEIEFGHIIVHSSKAEEKTDFMERILFIQNSETGKQLSVKQYQYTSWPATSAVPNNTVSFLHMIEEIKQHIQQTQTNPKAPMVVHCLNGAERSGLFCVVFSSLLLLQKERTVNIPYIIRTMQLPRPQVLTDLDQFKFCYTAVMEYIDRFQAYGNV